MMLGMLIILVAALALVWWVAARELHAAKEPPGDGGSRARDGLAGLIASVAAGGVAYRLILHHRLEQTAALFIGVPALIALIVVFGVRPRSAIGAACKAVTIGLFLSMMFLWEGILCIAMAAPLFYAVAVAIGGTVDYLRKRHDKHTSIPSIILLAFLPMSLEGVLPITSFDRQERVSATRIVSASSDDVRRALFETPRFDRLLPAYLRMGFPRPIASRIDRRSGVSHWTIRMRGGEMKINGMEPHAGDVVLALVDDQPRRLQWQAVSDDSHLTHFLDWRGASVEWEAIDEHATRVTWTLHYRRGLDPAWYFGPMERYAARLAAGYLIDAVATP